MSSTKALLAFCLIALNSDDNIALSIKNRIDNIVRTTNDYKGLLVNAVGQTNTSVLLEKFAASLDSECRKITNEIAENKELLDALLGLKYDRYKANEHSHYSHGAVKDASDILQYMKTIKMNFTSSEGVLNVYVDPIYINERFKDVLPEILLEFYRIESEDIKEGFESDAALDIPWDLLRIKIIRYENYFDNINKYEFPYIRNSIINKLNLYIEAYLKGTSNSRIYQCIDEARISYQRFMKENRRSRYSALIKSYYHDLDRNRFKFRQKEEIIDGRRYVNFMVVNERGTSVSILDLAESYLGKYKIIKK